MSDYWVSQQRHWCKYCKKFIQNNKPSIQLHENGLSHKNQVERFLRNVYKKGREDKEAADSTRLEIERIEREARKASGLHYAPTATTKRKATTTSTAGMHIPTIEELREQAAEEQRQRMVGREEWADKKDIAQVGEWEIVAPPPPPPTVEEGDEKKSKGTTHDQVPELLDDDEGQEDLHSFKIKEKELPVEPSEDTGEAVTFKKRKIESRKKKPLRKKD